MTDLNSPYLPKLYPKREENHFTFHPYHHLAICQLFRCFINQRKSKIIKTTGETLDN